MQAKYYKIVDKKKKKRERYTILITSNNGEGKSRNHSISAKALTFWTYFLILLFVIIITYGVYTVLVIGDGQGAIFSLRTQVEKLTEQNTELIVENAELQEQVEILSDSLNIKIAAEEKQKATEEALYTPTGIPLITDASMETTTEIGATGNDVPVTIFTVKSDTQVMAAGSGTVTFAGDDEEYGKLIMIDHGNGYVSVYKCNGELKVSANQIVTRDTLLFAVENETVIRFQIIKDGLYINPTEIMEIFG